MRKVVVPLMLSLAAWPSQAAEPRVAAVRPALETPNLPDNRFEADGDDPAIWLHPTDREDSLIVTAVKDGGIRVYDLRGRTVQIVGPVIGGELDGRINNVDVAYDVRLGGGGMADVVVTTDCGLDVIRIYRIDPKAGRPLIEITGADAGRAFPRRPADRGGGLEANPLEDQNTAYGVAVWNDRRGGEVLVVASQRGKARLGLFRLVPAGGGPLAAEFVRDFRFLVIHDGQDLRIENEDDPRRDWSPQFEGMTVNQRTGVLYAGQEDVGIWRVNLRTGRADARPFYGTRGSTVSEFREPRSVIARDVEGLCIWYGLGREAYLIASSQGAAHGDDAAPSPPYDDSFAVFDVDTGKPDLLGSFRVRAVQGIDAVQESDGADVISTGLPGFPGGLFVTQDGYDDDLDGLSGETDSTNFKLVPWQHIADAFRPRLAVAPNAWDPRDP